MNDFKFDPVTNKVVTHLDPTNLLENIKEWTKDVERNPNNELGKDSARRIAEAKDKLKEMGVKL
jgi:hypothetical protein